MGQQMSGFVGNVVGLTSKYTGLQRIRLTSFPEFDKKFTVLAKSEDQVRAFFTAERAQSLVALDSSVAVYAVGDSLEITSMNAQGKNTDNIMDAEIAAAIKLIQSLRV
jgi:hypothetical protein